MKKSKGTTGVTDIARPDKSLLIDLKALALKLVEAEATKISSKSRREFKDVGKCGWGSAKEAGEQARIQYLKTVNIDKFVVSLNHALICYLSSRQLIRDDNLSNDKKLIRRIVERYGNIATDLDALSLARKGLLTETMGKSAHVNIAKLNEFLKAMESFDRKPTDLHKRSFAKELADAMSDYLSIKPTSSDNSPYRQLLELTVNQIEGTQNTSTEFLAKVGVGEA